MSAYICPKLPESIMDKRLKIESPGFIQSYCVKVMNKEDEKDFQFSQCFRFLTYVHAGGDSAYSHMIPKKSNYIQFQD